MRLQTRNIPCPFWSMLHINEPTDIGTYIMHRIPFKIGNDTDSSDECARICIQCLLHDRFLTPVPDIWRWHLRCLLNRDNFFLLAIFISPMCINCRRPLSDVFITCIVLSRVSKETRLLACLDFWYGVCSRLNNFPLIRYIFRRLALLRGIDFVLFRALRF